MSYQIMRVGLVVQRYGEDVVGGAEAHARALARHLRADLGWDVEVFTTTARDYQTWANSIPAGTSHVDGIPVHRFPVESARSAFFPVFRRLAAPLIGTWGGGALERRYYEMQGPVSPALIAALVDQAPRFDRFLFFTYLYYTTVFGLPQVAAKAALVPTLHDEAPLRFPATRTLLEKARVILVNSEPERALALTILPAAAGKTHVVGVGLDLAAPDQVPAPTEPYLLYLGRQSAGKGVDRLVAHFEDFARKNPRSQLKLYLVGGRDPGFEAGKSSPNIVDLAFVDEATKAALIAHAQAIVSASPLESLSLVALEAAHCRRPLLLTHDCAIFRHYAQVLPTVATFENSADFAAALAGILATDWSSAPARARLDAAKSWVDERYSWAKVTEAYARYL